MTTTPPRKPRRYRWILYPVAGLIALLVALFGVLQTGPVRRIIETQLESRSAGMLQVRGLAGLLPFTLRMESIALTDPDGTWLHVDDLWVSLSPLSLLSGHVKLHRIAAETVQVLRAPAFPESVEPVENDLVVPALPPLPTWLSVDAIDIARIVVSDALLPETTAMQLSGAYDMAKEVPIRMHLKGLDGAPLEAALQAGWRGDTLAIALNAEDGALLPGMAGVEGPLTLAFTLQGPRDAAALSLEASLKGAPVVNLTGTLGLDTPIALKVDGSLWPPEPLLPEAARGKLGEALALTLDASVDAEGAVEIAAANLHSEVLRVTAQGHAMLDPMQVDMETELHYDDLYRFASDSTDVEALPLDAQADIRGGLDDLALSLTAMLSGEDWLTAETQLAFQDALSARGTLTALPAGNLLPPEIAELLRAGADADFDLRMEDGVLHIAKADARIDTATLSASGRMDGAAGIADLNLNAAADDLSVFNALSGKTLAGSLGIDALLEGDGTATTLTATLHGDALAVDALRAPTAAINATLTAGALNADVMASMALELSAALPGLELQPGLARDLTLDTTMTLAGRERLEVAHLKADDGNLHAEASGTVDLTSRQADFVAKLLVAELAAYAAPLGYPYGGALDLNATVLSGDTPGTLAATAHGRVEKLRGLPEGVGAATGDTASFALRGTYDGTAVQLDDLAANAGGIDLSASGRYGLEDHAIRAALHSVIADLAPFQALAGRPLAGSAVLDAEATGTLEQLAVKGTLDAEDLLADVLRADTARLVFDVQDLPADFNAEVTASMERDGAALASSASVSREATQITVARMKFNAGENVATLQGQWNLETQRGTGTLTADLPALAALHTWFDVPLEGAAQLDARLAENGETLRADFAATGLVVPGLSIASAQGKVALQSLFNTPSGTVDITATDLRAPDLAIAALNLQANGPASALQFDLQTEGTYKQVLPFSLAATGAAGTAPRQLTLDALDAAVDSKPITLTAPATLRAVEDGYTVTPVRLQIAGGTLALEGMLDGDRVNARAAWEAVPLALAELAGQPPYRGTSSGSVALSGPAREPVAELTMHIAGLRTPIEDGDARGIDAQLEATLDGGRARAKLSAGISEVLQLEGDLSAPATWSLSPWRFELPPGGALDGHILGDGQLASIPELLGIEGHDLRGALHADVGIGGTTGAPALNGGVDLSEGYYENHTTGTILDGLTVRLEAAATTFRLTQFEAVDGTGGTLSATGEFLMADEFPFSVDAALSNMRLAHRDDISARAGGTIALRGDRSGANVEGDIQAGPATINLPERLPEQQLTTVDFRVAGAPVETEEPLEAPSVFPVALDIDCTIPGQVWVNGPGLESEWAGDLNVSGTVQEPVLRGTLRARNGNLIFLGRDFDLGQSTIAFSGQSPPSPALNIVAVSTNQDITARVRLEGELESLNVTLESDPPLPEDEVLSQVLFGSSLSEVTPFQALQLARYAPLFSSRVSGLGLLSASKTPAMLDRLSLQTGADIADTTVAAGKKLSDNLYLEFEQGASTESTAVSLEWLFAPNWSLEGSTRANAEGGVGVFWKRDY